jgi:hypothetical protein
LPDGTNYVGAYNIYKDGTVMTAADSDGNEQILTPLTSVVTTKARASQLAATTLLGTSTSYEKTIIQGLITTHYDQVSVSSEYCLTADAIPSTGQPAGTSTGAVATKTISMGSEY